MLDYFRDVAKRHLIPLFIALPPALLGGTVLSPTVALADHSDFKASMMDVLGACKKAGGVFSDDDGGYGCTKNNCDGKGGSCTVGCTRDEQCKGSTPKIMVGKVTILMLLQNGSNVDHSVVLAEPNHGSPAPPSDAASRGAVAGSPAGGPTVGGPPSFL
ncbi:MAG TPA: hypothetical protein VG966_12630 [Hyphomicrobiaceae bacterium]|nr:hypothetical protein [Hyphomicrobiaceae bacterium]